ncbi:hypothetical protein NW762_007085 [Fusarium torreyae]|uniref:F-box domain-containing protein n=1 Tax=Fusarium torreyae TaxID=1237075 RepID=A0A9W8VH49_9HYPO|nr:hypothetical protein NW762_007085 [Fusarium torreyae]
MSLQVSYPSNSNRRLQRSKLVLLPTELLLSIIQYVAEDRHFDINDLRHLALSSSRLFDLVRPFFYRANDYEQFYNAVSLSSTDMMARCEQFDAAPVNIIWKRLSQRFRPIERLMWNLNEHCSCQVSTEDRDFTRARIYRSLEWLVKRGADARPRMALNMDGSEHGAFEHMPTRLLTQFQLGNSKSCTADLCGMIQLLSSHGFPNPTRCDSLGGWSIMTEDLWFRDKMAHYLTNSPMDLAFKSHVPPSLLDLMLCEYDDRDLKLTDWHPNVPSKLFDLAKESDFDGTFNMCWVETSYIDRLLGTLHADLHNASTKWTESYPGEVADVFEEKMELMIKHQAVDTSEQALLKSIHKALCDITAVGIEAGGLGDAHFKLSWEKLCNAVRPFANDTNLALNPSTQPGKAGPGRIHRFAIDVTWNPWWSWFLREDATNRYQLMEASGTIREVSSRKWERKDEYFDYFLKPFLRKVDELPDWHSLSLEDWCYMLQGDRLVAGIGYLPVLRGSVDRARLMSEMLDELLFD